MLLCPVPQKFNTFNTFNTFAVVTPALEHPTLIHPQSPRLHATPPLLSPTGEGGKGVRDSKPPASRPVRLYGGDTKHRVEGEPVEVPGRWSRARRAVRRRERLALHFRWPATLAVEAGQRLQRRPIGHPGRLALQNEVDTFQAHGDRAGRVLRQIARLAGARPAGEIDIAVVPERADAGGVRSPVRSRCAEEDLGHRRVGETIA